MNITTIQKLIAKRIATMPNYNPKAWVTGNHNYVPTDIWHRLSLQSAGAIMSGMADKPMSREIGAVVVQVFTRQNIGEKRAVEQADTIANHLAYYTDENLELLTPSVVIVGSDNDWWQVNVRVPYRYK
ncbi:DUF4128 domain-containing protein [Moraxella nasovis]|uniref:phage tail terminator-like protein n=1 Tax=Moraxella nasovis TaxID=2904121 RepID=UPI001F618A46|nr:phage tail terminator-like protein [Moraxella nasovis]UNU74108.1 DUF4128 domain-containing protein [Moraxella nasovis]